MAIPMSVISKGIEWPFPKRFSILHWDRPQPDLDDEDNDDDSTYWLQKDYVQVRAADADSTSFEERMPVAFPEGGLTAWLTIFGAFLVQFACFGYINSFGVYQDFYVRKYLTKYTPSAIGWIGGVQVFLNFCTGAITGKIFDKGYLRAMMIASVVLQALGLFMLSLSQENSYYQVFLSHGITFGLASGISYVPSLGVAGHYFQKKRPLAIGIISSGSALGAVLHPIMLNHFFSGSIGFRNGVRISATINLFLLIVATLIMRIRLPPKQAQRFPIAQWLSDPVYLMLIIGCTLAFFGLFFPVFYLQLYAMMHGVDKNFAFYATSILNAASFFGRWAPGPLAQYMGVMNLGTFMIFGTGIIIFCMYAVHDKTSTIFFAVFFGFFSGAGIAAVPAMSANLAKDPSELGVRIGLAFAAGGIVGLVATPISGALLTNRYLWIRPIVFSGLTMCIACAFFGIMTVLFARRRKTWRV